jgi:hypothetical protein
MLSVGILVALNVQMIIYSLKLDCSLQESWKQTGRIFSSFFALDRGRDGKFITTALVLTVYVSILTGGFGLIA